MNDNVTFLREMSFKVGTNTVTFYKLYNDCWVCVLPEMVARRIQFETFPYGDIRLDQLEFSTRARNAFISEEIETVADLVRWNYRLMKIANMGKKTYWEVISVLEANKIKEAALILRSAWKQKTHITHLTEEA